MSEEARGVVRPYRWVRADPRIAHEVVERLDAALAEWEAVSSALTRHTGPVPSGGPDPRGPIQDVRAAMQLVRNAFADLADTLDRLRPILLDLDIDQHRRTWVERARGGTPARVVAVRTQMRTVLSELAEADGRCRQAVEKATRRLPDPERLDTPWLPILAVRHDAVAPPAPATPEAAGVAVPLPAVEEEIIGAVAAMRYVAPVPVRALLTGLDTAELGDLLDRRPAVAGILTGDRRLPRDLPPPLADVLHGKHDTSLHHVVAVRRIRVDEATWDRWGLLWPATVGPLDGAPLRVRIAANRRLARAALCQARREDLELGRAAEAFRQAHTGPWWDRARGAATLAWVSREPLAAIWALPIGDPALLRADLRVRIRWLESVLHGTLPNGRGGAEPRRLLSLDATGRGRAVELCGVLDERTRHLVLHVPGTGTTARGFHLPVGFARDVVEADRTGQTAVVAWMDTDFPQGFANESPFVRFAAQAAEPLRNARAGLDLPEALDVTAVGHSYGGVIVGAAERQGLQVDRVLHIASAGAGPGVHSIADYPDTDPLGAPRRVRRFALTAPADPVRWAQRTSRALGWLPGPVRDPVLDSLALVNLGVDPAALEGVTVLDAGGWEQEINGHQIGEPLRGPAAHATVLLPGTTSFRRIMAVITGADPTT